MKTTDWGHQFEAVRVDFQRKDMPIGRFSQPRFWNAVAQSSYSVVRNGWMSFRCARTKASVHARWLSVMAYWHTSNEQSLSMILETPGLLLLSLSSQPWKTPDLYFIMGALKIYKHKSLLVHKKGVKYIFWWGLLGTELSLYMSTESLFGVLYYQSYLPFRLPLPLLS